MTGAHVPTYCTEHDTEVQGDLQTGPIRATFTRSISCVCSCGWESPAYELPFTPADAGPPSWDFAGHLRSVQP